MAALIGAILRPTLPAAPLIGFSAPKQGTGKSYLVDLIAAIATGSRAVCVATGGDLQEMEKTLGAALLDGRPLLSLDNLVQPLAGQFLSMILTQETVQVRVLGLSKMAEVSTGTAMFATGNNLAIKGDMVRRTLLLRLDAKTENPESRDFDRDPLAEALQRRPELVSAALTIARWRHVWPADAPDPWARVAGALPLSGFSEWCRRVRDPLVALGHADPVRSLDVVRSTDNDEDELAALTQAWRAAFKTRRRRAERRSMPRSATPSCSTR